MCLTDQLNALAGARSTISWYDFEVPWQWQKAGLAQGKLTTHGMQQARHDAELMSSTVSEEHARIGGFSWPPHAKQPTATLVVPQLIDSITMVRNTMCNGAKSTAMQL